MLTALVLTHDRPRLADQTVRYLMASEQIAPGNIVLVVNGQGGLEDKDLERRVQRVNTGANLGPAGGFAFALDYVHDRQHDEWCLVCEDDIGLLALPSGRVRRVLESVEAMPAEQRRRVGAVTAYGRVLDDHTGRTVPHQCAAGGKHELEQVDAAAWGATLVHRRVLEAGIRPDPSLYFGFEDFDFFMRMTAAGLDLYVDCVSELAVAGQVSVAGRRRIFPGWRPTDTQEPWRNYYFARNFVHLARRYGSMSWVARLPIRLARRWMLDARVEVAAALVHGFIDGLRGKLDVNARYQRATGESTVLKEHDVGIEGTL